MVVLYNVRACEISGLYNIYNELGIWERISTANNESWSLPPKDARTKNNCTMNTAQTPARMNETTTTATTKTPLRQCNYSKLIHETCGERASANCANTRMRTHVVNSSEKRKLRNICDVHALGTCSRRRFNSCSLPDDGLIFVVWLVFWRHILNQQCVSFGMHVSHINAEASLMRPALAQFVGWPDSGGLC